ncbi:Spermatogenesis-Associated Protein 31E1 [Manis pentadactyla]|nr:Spermatogenesis-Associated Protein 31E1 [Manis pentadactyla]
MTHSRLALEQVAEADLKAREYQGNDSLSSPCSPPAIELHKTPPVSALDDSTPPSPACHIALPPGKEAISSALYSGYMFIDPLMKPKIRRLSETYMEQLFELDDQLFCCVLFKTA